MPEKQGGICAACALFMTTASKTLLRGPQKSINGNLPTIVRAQCAPPGHAELLFTRRDSDGGLCDAAILDEHPGLYIC